MWYDQRKGRKVAVDEEGVCNIPHISVSRKAEKFVYSL